MICKLLQYQGAPEVETDKFSENTVEYQCFGSMFNQVVEKKVSDQTGRLTGLLTFTGGKAKKSIKHCIHLPPETGYETVVRLLNNKYLHYLHAPYRKEIKALSSVKYSDASGFRKFHSFVLKCETFCKSTAWNSLETPEILCILVSKLSGNLRDRWNGKVQVVWRVFGREPFLSNFVSFGNEETTLVSDAIFSKDAVWSIFRRLKGNMKKETWKFCHKRGRSGKRLSVWRKSWSWWL